MSTLMTRTWKRSGSTFRRSDVITRLSREELKFLQKRTKAQWRFWIFLQDEENRSLTVVELCRRLGYAGPRQWFKAVEDEGFRAEIEGLGVRTPSSSTALNHCLGPA